VASLHRNHTTILTDLAQSDRHSTVPTAEEQEYIHHKLFSEIELGIIRDETRDALLAIVRQMIERDGIEFLVLGCTELPLILPDEAFGIPLLNTTALHVERIVAECQVS
jgi:aspartate racemase